MKLYFFGHLILFLLLCDNNRHQKQKRFVAQKAILCRKKKQFDVAQKVIWYQLKQVDAARKSVSCRRQEI